MSLFLLMPQPYLSVLTVVSRQTPVAPLAEALSRQELPKHIRREWSVVDLDHPGKADTLQKVHRELLSSWRIAYTSAPAVMKGVAATAALKNAAALACGTTNPTFVTCVPLGFSQMPVSPRYLFQLWDALKRNKLLVPVANRLPVMSAAPFRLDDFFALNGCDELYDAGDPEAPSADLVARLSEWFEVAGGPELKFSTGVRPPQVKCDHTLRGVQEFISWEANRGFIPNPVLKAFRACPELVRENCRIRGGACPVLHIARGESPRMDEFLASRPTYDLGKIWAAGKRWREKVTLCTSNEIVLRS